MTTEVSGGSNIVEMSDVHVRYGERRHLRLPWAAPATQDGVRAVDGVDLEIRRGEVLGLIGESGSGKSTLARTILGMAPLRGGTVRVDGVDVHAADPRGRRELRRKVQIVLQDPVRSLSPRMKIGQAVAEPLRVHSPQLGARGRAEKVNTALEQVGLTPGSGFMDRYPHELSGGQLQRVVLARALVCEPDLVILDEALASADASNKARLLSFLLELKRNFGLTYLFITHDLALARYICDRVAILYLGKVVELGEVAAVYEAPTHPYTEALLGALPTLGGGRRKADAFRLEGEIPSARRPPGGCRLHPRCPLSVRDLCDVVEPELVAATAAHQTACHVRRPEPGILMREQREWSS